jgi:hypothetical protein
MWLESGFISLPETEEWATATSPFAEEERESALPMTPGGADKL